MTNLSFHALVVTFPLCKVFDYSHTRYSYIFSVTIFLHSPCRYMRAWIHIELPVAIAEKTWIRVLDTASCYELAAPPCGQIESQCGFKKRAISISTL